MKVILATGIYPPDIGGPATYTTHLAEELYKRGIDVTVVTYGKQQGADVQSVWPIVRVSKAGGPILRWLRYAKTLKQYGSDADIVYAFSSISCGVPLYWARLKGPKKMLRLGGDFLWERYSGRGGQLSLHQWYESGPWFQGQMNGILKTFDHIVFSTAFQEQLYERMYRSLPLHSVIENAQPGGDPVQHQAHESFRLVFLGRYVFFKNLANLLEALHELPSCTLTLAGSGPLERSLQAKVQRLGLGDRVRFVPPVHGEQKKQLLHEHDLMVMPSTTEISPNAALEARAHGLPVLLTEETGLSRALAESMMIATMRTPQQIASAVRKAKDQYVQLSARAAAPMEKRGWGQVAEEHVKLFQGLL